MKNNSIDDLSHGQSDENIPASYEETHDNIDRQEKHNISGGMNKPIESHERVKHEEDLGTDIPDVGSVKAVHPMYTRIQYKTIFSNSQELEYEAYLVGVAHGKALAQEQLSKQIEEQLNATRGRDKS